VLAFVAVIVITWLALPIARTAPGVPQTAPAAPAPQTSPIVSVQGTPVHDTAKAAEVLAEARNAIGGEDKLRAVQRLELKGKAVRLMSSSVVEGDFEVQIDLPGKYRRKEAIRVPQNDGEWAVDWLQILNGVLASQKVEQLGGNQWRNDNQQGQNASGNRGGRNPRNMNWIATILTGAPPTTDLDPRAQEEALHLALSAELARFTLAWLLTTAEEVAWVGTAVVPAGKVDVLDTKTPDGVVTRLLVSEKTRLPLMLGWTGNTVQTSGWNQRGSSQSIQMRKAPLQIYLSDYKAVQGLKLPHLIQRGANDETTEELIVRSYRINPVFRPETFEHE
jgi:hypothetical protein